MPLSFLTKSQQFVFVDPSITPPPTVNPEAAQPNHLYDIFLVLQNTDGVEYSNVQVNVSHGAFAIGFPAGVQGLTQPQPVDVPPQASVPGTATVEFSFVTPAGGHGCLTAQIAPQAGLPIAPGGGTIGQNVTAISVASGVSSTVSFLVLGGAAKETMVLTLTESIQNGATIPAGSPQSWKPLLVAPPGTGPTAPAPSPMTLNLAAQGVYLVGLQVTIPANATTAHVFNIVGTLTPSNQYEGEVSITVNPVAGLVPPDPYITGSYQSADILLFDADNNPVPLGGQPGGAWDTLLEPNQNYQLAAVVHNDSATPAVNTMVSFWQLPGGVGSVGGTLLDVRTVTVPANDSVTVYSNVWFTSAPLGQHRCAVVDIYNSQSLTATVYPLASNQIPDPTSNVAHSVSAWRNTDSMFVVIGKPFSFTLHGDAGAAPAVTATAKLVAAGYETTADAVSLRQTLEAAGARTVYPPYLTPALQAKLPAADLKIAVSAPKAVTIAQTATTTIAANEFTISGTVPTNATAGDIYLVQVSAKYPDKTVGFLEVLHVQAS